MENVADDSTEEQPEALRDTSAERQNDHVSLLDIFGEYEPAPSKKRIASAAGETDRAKIWPYISSVVPADIDYSHFGIRPLFLGVFFGAFKVDNPDKVRTLAGTFDLTKRYLAPFMLKTAIDMIPDFMATIQRNPKATIIFVGRDAFSLGYIVNALCPQFYKDHCRALYLSRSIVDAALQELEETEGRSFAAVEAFRKRPSQRTSPGPAWQALTKYFQDNDIELDREGSEVHLVDTGYKGSVQEMLSAAYPRTHFFGHYVFFGESPLDPHPGSKKGYALHLDTTRSSGGLAVRGRLPDDPELTFTHHEAILVVEELLQGSELSPSGLSPFGKPLTLRYRNTPRPLEGLNPVLVAPEYTDLYLREGVLSFNVMVVSRLAHRLAHMITGTGPDWYLHAQKTKWYARLVSYEEDLREQVRRWVGRREVMPALGRYLDSFIHRIDQRPLTELSNRLQDAGLTDDQQRPIWEALCRRTTLPDVEAFVRRSIDEMIALAMAEKSH